MKATKLNLFKEYHTEEAISRKDAPKLRGTARLMKQRKFGFDSHI